MYTLDGCFVYIHYWSDFASTGSFITQCTGTRFGPPRSAAANSRLRRQCESVSTPESSGVPDWLLRDLINPHQFTSNLMQFFVRLCMYELKTFFPLRQLQSPIKACCSSQIVAINFTTAILTTYHCLQLAWNAKYFKY